MVDRRGFLAGLAATASLGAVGSVFTTAATAATNTADAALAALLQQHAELYLAASPEDATGYGFDTGPHAALRSRLDDRSLGAIHANRKAVQRAAAALARIDRAQLSPAAVLDYDVASYIYSTLSDQLGRYGYVDINLRPSPYVVSQMNGAYYWLPEFLGSRHPLETAADAQAYLARLSALAKALDQETDRIRHDAGLGVVPPDFVLAKTIQQIRVLRDMKPGDTAMIGPAAKRAEAKGQGELGPRAAAIFAKEIVPALSRQIAALEKLTARAGPVAGVWFLPDGDAYYASAARSNTTADLSPAELHRIGLDQVARLTAELDASLRAQGFGSGSVGARIDALNCDPRYLPSADDAGREMLLEAARKQIATVEGLLPKAFRTLPGVPVDVRRIPVAIENGAPGAFYNHGGSGKPGTYMLNLKSPGEFALWRLPTLTHHEAVPGHHFQFSVLGAAGDLPLARRIPRFSAYTEGWALYAQRVADEIGIYENDPVGRIGLLQSELFRATRIVVDTGLHHKHWTRDQAIQWMVENAGEQPGPTQREIDRYCVYPGQACSFMIGQQQILAQREAARARLGAKFDVRAFHDLILRAGPVPMQVLGSMVESWQGA